MNNVPDQERLRGEGSYSAGRRFDESVRRIVNDGRVGEAACAAEPGSPAEAEELRRAEATGKAHSMGESPIPTARQRKP
jgi:hypothetical protein